MKKIKINGGKELKGSIKISGAKEIGNKKSNKTTVRSGFSKIIVMLATTAKETVIAGWIGMNWEIAAPTATLAKIAGKILPPRHPIANPAWVEIVFIRAINSKNNGE